MGRDDTLFRSYLLPLLLTVLLIVTSVLIGFLKLTSLVLASALFAVVGLCVFSSELLISKASRREEQRNAYTFVTSVLVRERNQAANCILTLDEVLAIEASASEVWIYAYDLGWENENSGLSEVVKANLGRGVKYRYLVPNLASVLLRVEHLQRKYSATPPLDKLVRFRSRPRELKLVQFGIAIYNPSLLSGGTRAIGECVVVFFPHYQLCGPTESPLFFTLRGHPTTEVQEGFCELWNEAAEVPQPTREVSEAMT
jgi:hypothetical protein